MNIENGKKWSEALKSGKFKQTRGTLKGTHDSEIDGFVKGGFCCLGVACQIAGINVMRGRPYDLVQGWLCLSHDEMTRYVKLNDNERANFDQIAAVVDKTLETSV